MKNALAGIGLALALFVAAAACWSEARRSRSVAEAHRRLATLHYDADDRLTGSQSLWTELPWPSGTAKSDIDRQRATVSYWRTQYQSLGDLTAKSGAQALSDPEMLLVVANASFRSAAAHVGPPKAAVGRLDAVIQAYADVLRRSPANTDAAYNYEFVSRLRDYLAKGANRAGQSVGKKPEAPADTTVDLPAGPTIHGAPGGPPPGTDLGDFKTLTPMRYDEREERMDPGPGHEVRRKG